MGKSSRYLIAAAVLLATAIIGIRVFLGVSHLDRERVPTVAERELTGAAPDERIDLGEPEEPSLTPEEVLTQYPELKKLKQLQEGVNASVEFFGRILDQNGDPVADAVIEYSIPHYEVGILPSAIRSEGRGSVRSDADGSFKITGSGGFLTIYDLKKAGYVIEDRNPTFIYRRRSRAEVRHEPDVNNPVIFQAWKKTETARELKRGEDYWTYRTDGKYYKVPMQGLGDDLQVNFELLGSDAKDEARQWRVTLKMPDGGLVESADAFMYEAPASGYQTEWVAVANENDRLEKRFYIKARNGQIHGRLVMTFRGYYGDREETRNKGFIRYQYTLNPTGSRNLLSDKD